MKKWQLLAILIPLLVGTIAMVVVQAGERALQEELHQQVETHFIQVHEEAVDAVEKLNAEALLEIKRINRLRESNKDVKDLHFWERLNKQGDEIKRIAEEIGATRDALMVIKAACYLKPSPTRETFRQAADEVTALHDAIKDIRKSLDDLKSL